MDKITIRVKEGPVGSETPWAEIEGGVATLKNDCWFVRLGHGDKVRVEKDGDDCYQVVELLERNPESYSWQVLLITEEEVESGSFPDEMESRGRWVTFEHDLEQALAPIQFSAEGGHSIGPGLFTLSIEGAFTADEVMEIDEHIHNLATEHRITAYAWTSPDDDLGAEEILEDIEFSLFEGLPRTNTTYRAADDNFWPPDPKFRQWVQELADTDPRVAKDLEAIRYDRVVTLIQRMMTPPEDLVPLDGPIWED
jgi:hypothetical protein